MSEWQPIETAPMDGTRVLVFVPQLSMIFACEFIHGFWQMGILEKNPPQPTHWMPLPEAPKAK